MELEFYLKSFTGKSYSNMTIAQRLYVNEGLNVAAKQSYILLQ